MALDQNLGLKKNPFSKKSSEQELHFLHEIFYQPNYYITLMDVLSSGDSRFIIGQRGHGKSSIINKLFEDLEQKRVFTIKVDRFDSIPIKKNETALLKLIITLLVTKLSIFLEKNPKKIKSLNKVDKEKLAFFVRVFFESISKSEYDKIYNNIIRIRSKNLGIRFLNFFSTGIANVTTSALVTITSSTIRQSLGLPDIESNEILKEYFIKIPELKNDKIELADDGETKEKLKQILDDVLSIIEKIGFCSTTVLFDKIDEYQNLNQDISKITNFTSEILSDTELLLNNRFAIGFSLWSELKSELAGVVRFDKFGTIDVRWQDSDLRPLINKRLRYFSISKQKPVTLEKLVPIENDRDEIIKVSNKSPRDLISALAEIFQVQANKNANTNIFESQNITKGLVNFCAGYDYDSITPSRSGKNKEIKAMINRLLKVRLNRFSTKDVTIAFNQSNRETEGQIKIMLQYKLIREDEILGLNNEKYFEVIDPKVVYLIRRGYTQIE